MTTALEVVRCQRHAPAVFYPRERPGNHCTGGWMGVRAGLDRCGKSRPPPHPGFDPRTVQPVASRYTNWATRPTGRWMVSVRYHSVLWNHNRALCCLRNSHDENNKKSDHNDYNFQQSCAPQKNSASASDSSNGVEKQKCELNFLK